jgi:hypothetical protein
MGLFDALGIGSNPFVSWLSQNHNSLGSAFGGLVGAANPHDALVGFTKGLNDPYAGQADTALRQSMQQQQDADKAARAEQLRQQQFIDTLLKRNRPDLAEFVRSGGDIKDATKAWLADEASSRQAAAEKAKREGTAKFLVNPELRTAYASGELSWNDAYKLDKGGTADPGRYGTTLPFIDAEGHLQYQQLARDGDPVTLPVPEGGQWAINTTQLDLGDHMEGVDKYGRTSGPSRAINNFRKAFDTEIGKGAGAAVNDQHGQAQDAALSLASAQEAEKLLDSGMITGFGADFRVGFGKALQLAGYHGADDEIANTEAFVATRAQEVGRLIKMFGAGTGLSDADRAYAEKAAAGSIALTEESIRKILELNRRAAQNVLARYNSKINAMNANGGTPDMTVMDPTAPNGPTATDPLGLGF